MHTLLIAVLPVMLMILNPADIGEADLNRALIGATVTPETECETLCG